MKKTLSSFLLICLLCSACKKDIDLTGDDNELITTVKLHFSEGETHQIFTYKDIDGESGMPPSIEKIVLKPNTNYQIKAEFLDESKTPATDLSSEILKEAVEHLVYYTPSPSSIGSYTYKDKDGNNLPIGLSGDFRTSMAQVGKLKIQLRHQPVIGNVPTKTGTLAPGTDDVNIDFDLEIK
jgi:hypothetical protein